jgi:N-acyl homoserine lactone hydrolase
MKRKAIPALLALGAAVLVLTSQAKGADPGSPKPPHSLRLYVMDCGTLRNANPDRYNLKRQDVATTDMSDPCFLVMHPKGTLIWDTGVFPDDAWTPTGSPIDQHIVLPDGQERSVTVVKSLKAQLAEIGYAPAQITYLVLSHYHYDHTANANEFAGSTWLARPIEREAMFAEKAPPTTRPDTYSALRDCKTVNIDKDEYDVFGDGKVILKFTPGHTPGHQSIFLKLAKTGPVLLSGDLYHYPAERTLDRVPKFDFNPDQTRASRAMIEGFLKKSSAQLWIQHDFVSNAKLKKSPSFYE